MAPPVTGPVAQPRYRFRRSAQMLVGGILLGFAGGLIQTLGVSGLPARLLGYGRFTENLATAIETAGFIVAVIGTVMVVIGIYRAASNIDVVAQRAYDKQLRRQLRDEGFARGSHPHSE